MSNQYYIDVVLIRMIEIALRECRFGGSKTRWLSLAFCT